MVGKLKRSKNSARDFEIFARGVERLEQIKKELKNLTTSGYEQETASIKSKLNNVSYIPEIEKEMIDLKSKINGTYKKKSIDSHEFIHRKIRELKKAIPTQQQTIHRKIRELSERVHDTEHVKKKIFELEKEIANLPKFKKELESFKEFIERQRVEEERKKEILGKIDPDTNFMINDKFNLSLNDIKAELIKKLRNKEINLQREFHEDLEITKKSFEEKYKNLELAFDKKYQDRVKASLKEEVKNKFNILLYRRLNFLRNKMEQGNIKKLDEEEKELKIKLKNEERELTTKERKKIFELNKARNELEKLKKEIQSKSFRELKLEKNKLNKKEMEKLFQLQKSRKKAEELKKELEEKILSEEKKTTELVSIKLSEKLARKKTALENIFKNELKTEKDKLRKHYEEEILVHQVLLDKKMHEDLTEEARKVHDDYNEKLKKEKIETRKVHDGYNEKLKKEKIETRKVHDDYNEKLKKEKMEIIKRKEEIEKEKKLAIEKAIREQSQKLREKFKKEFEERLNFEIMTKEAEFEKKKANLTLQIQKKAKELFV